MLEPKPSPPTPDQVRFSKANTITDRYRRGDDAALPQTDRCGATVVGADRAAVVGAVDRATVVLVDGGVGACALRCDEPHAVVTSKSATSRRRIDLLGPLRGLLDGVGRDRQSEERPRAEVTTEVDHDVALHR